MITPTTPANIYDFNETVISIPLITLAAHVVALKRVVSDNFDPMGIESKARALLSCPEDYPIEGIYDHLKMCLSQTHDHYGIT
jgi:hypothetical protein